MFRKYFPTPSSQGYFLTFSIVALFIWYLKEEVFLDTVPGLRGGSSPARTDCQEMKKKNDDTR